MSYDTFCATHSERFLSYAKISSSPHTWVQQKRPMETIKQQTKVGVAVTSLPLTLRVANENCICNYSFSPHTGCNKKDLWKP